MSKVPLVERWINASLFDLDPIVSLTSMNPTDFHLFEMMKKFPELFSKRSGVHFIFMTWSVEKLDLQPFARAFREAQSTFPNHCVIMVTGTEFETYRWSSLGIRCIAGNGAIFQDEDRWTTDAEPFPELPVGTAFYNAHFSPFKRHQLCSLLEQPLFVHGFDPNDVARKRPEGIKEICPTAVLVNEALNGNTYRYLDEAEISRVCANASTALCLSAEEGHMRASIQALLCGLPVVSTRSIGGRDRYYTPDNSLIVDATPEAVAEGVRQIAARGLTRREIRKSALDLILADRREFTRTVNRVLVHQLGPDYPEFRFEDVAGWYYKTVPIKNLIRSLRAL